MTEKQQPGACLQCHAANLALYRFVGKGDVQKGFEQVSGMPYAEARNLKDDKGQLLVQHPVACVDCHEPKTMGLRVTRPGFLAGIKALKAKQGVADYDPNRDATRQEMRSFVCGQCHVEYYFKGPGKVVTYPWANGLKVEEIEAYYEREGFTDWVHAETGDKVLKAQHPEFEVWSQGVHARAGVACADCHMPYERVGAHQGERPLGAEPAPEPEPRLPDLPRSAGEESWRHACSRSRIATTRCWSARPGPPPTCWTPSWPRRRAGLARPTSRRPPLSIGRRNGGSTSWPPRTPWAFTPRRSWRGSSGSPSTTRARASSRRSARCEGGASVRDDVTATT